MRMDNIRLHEALTCDIDESVINIAKKLESSEANKIFVVDSEKKLHGIITTTDITYKVISKKGEDLRAKDVMTKDVKHIDISEDSGKALAMMNELKNFQIPMTRSGELLGIVAYDDILSYETSSMASTE